MTTLVATPPIPAPHLVPVLDVTLHGEPQQWMRALPEAGEVRNPKAYQDWLTRAAVTVVNAWMLPPKPGTLRRVRPPVLDEPLMVECVFWFARPKTRPAVIPAWWWEMAACPAVGRMDADNLAAAVLDAVTRAGVWRDDTRCVRLEARKVYLPPGRADERTTVRVSRWVMP